MAKRDDEREPAGEPTITTAEVDTLPPPLQGQEERHEFLYPEYLKVDVNKNFPLACVHSGESMYRGGDVPPFPHFKKCGSAVLCARKRPDSTVATTIEHPMRPVVRVAILTGRKAGIKENVYWHCNANSLTRDVNQIGIRFAAGDSAANEKLPNNGFVDALAQDKRLLVTELTLDMSGRTIGGVDGKPVWTGIRQEEVEDIAHRQANGDKLDDWQLAVHALETCSSLRFYTRLPLEAVSQLPSFELFVRTVFYVSAHLGNFWYYALAMDSEETGGCIDYANYPFDEIPPPRWMVRRWKVTYRDDKPIQSEPCESSWFSEFPSQQYSDNETFAFETALATAREALYARHLLREQDNREQSNSSLDKVIVNARFHPNHESTVYVVEMYFSGAFMENGHYNPPLGTKCQVAVQVHDKAINLVGETIDDVLLSGAHCTAVLRPKHPTAAPIPPDALYKVTLNFRYDSTAIKRSLDALHEMNSCQGCEAGIFLPELYVGGPRPLNHDTNWLHKYIGTSRRLWVFHAELARHRLSEEQMKIAMDSIAPGPGGLLIWGAGGTGKTKAALAVVKALLRCGVKFLVTATTNAAVDGIVNVFLNDKPLESANFDPLGMVRFSGAMCKTRLRTGAVDRRNDVEPERLSETKQEAHDHEAPVSLSPSSSPDLGPMAVDGAAGLPPQTADMPFDALRDVFEMVALKEAGSQVWYGFNRQKLAYVESIAKSKPTTASRDEVTETSSLASQTKLVNPGKPNLARRLAAGTPSSQSSVETHESAKLLELASNLRSGTYTTKQGKKADSKEFRRLDVLWSQRYLSRKVKIMFATNNTSAHDLLRENYEPDALFRDEASQASPSDAVIPAGCHKKSVKFVLMAGDHKQPKPVVISGALNESLPVLQTAVFTKLFRIKEHCQFPVVMLTKQYRMHSQLLRFPNKFQYDGVLVNAPRDREDAAVDENFDNKITSWLEPLRAKKIWNGHRRIAIDMHGHGKPQPFHGTTSLLHEAEAQLIADQCEFLLRFDIDPADIMVITPYHSQRRHIEKLLRSRKAAGIRVFSIFGSQNQEGKIVFLSLVNNVGRVDFVADERRLNVALTRAQRMLVIFADFNYLKQEIDSRQYRPNHISFFAKMCRDIRKHKDLIAANRFQKGLGSHQ